MPDARCQEPGSLAGVRHSHTRGAAPSHSDETPRLEKPAPFSGAKDFFLKPAGNIGDISADNTVLHTLTKTDTEINPQRNILNCISRRVSPEHFKQASKFGELSPGIRERSLFSLVPQPGVALQFLNRGDTPPKKHTHALFVSQTWHQPQLSFISCVALGQLSNLSGF